MSKTQTRGNCQCCGRQQAVRGTLAQHGYTVEHGYFEGVCQGHRFAPLQVERAQADRIIAQCRKDAVELDARAAALLAREIDPVEVPKPNEYVRRGEQPTMVRFAELPGYEQRSIISVRAANATSRARLARGFANDLEKLADALHGTDLIVVQLPEGPAPIQAGERRKSGSGSVLVARYQERGRVYWKRESDGFQGWTGTQSWRAMEAAP